MHGTRCVNLPMRGSPRAQRRQSADPRSPQLWSGPCQSAGCHSSAVRQPTIGGAAGSARPQALTVHSAAPDRHTYLRRPDLGRQLADESRRPRRQRRPPRRPAAGDRRRPLFWAVERRAVPLIRALLPYLRTLGIGTAPVVLAHQSRVALGMILAKP